MTEQVDIAVIGGGMVGLSQALLLAQQLPAQRICVLESTAWVQHSLPETSFQQQAPQQASADEHPGFDGRSSALSVSTIDLFRQLDIWDRLEPLAQPITRVHVSDRGHVGRVDFSAKDNGDKPLGYVVENRVLGQHLIAAVRACANIEVKAPARVSRLRPLADGARLEYEAAGSDIPPCERRELLASLAVIADGADSPLRQQLGIGVDTDDYQQSAIIANVAFEKPHNGHAFERFTEDGPLALLPLPSLDNGASRRMALVWTRPDQRLDEALALSDSAFAEQIQRRFGYRLGRCVRTGERLTYKLQRVFAREQVRRGLVFVGNAAHLLHPVAGQGFNLALRDSAQLAAVLRQANADGQALGDLNVLRRYECLQQRDQQLTSTLSHSFVQLFGSSSPWLQLGRNLGLLAMDWNDTARTLFFEQMMGKSLPRAQLLPAESNRRI